MTTKKSLSSPLLHQFKQSSFNNNPTNSNSNSIKTHGRLRILLTDADPEMAKILKAYLDYFVIRKTDFPKFDVIACSKKIQTSQKLLFGQFDLIIIDSRLSSHVDDMGGIDLLHELRIQS